MKNRYIFTFALFLIVGIILCVSFELNLFMLVAISLLLAVLSALFAVLCRKYNIAVISAALICGITLAFFAGNTSSKALAVYDGQSISGTMIITEITHTDYYSYGTARLININGNEADEKISLFISGEKKFFVNDTAEFRNLKLTLTGIPGESMNDGGFDYVLYNRSKGIFYEGNVKGADMKSVSDFSHSLLKSARAVKSRISARISDVFSNNDHAGMLTGLFVGDKELISDETYSFYRLAGISHILCVSGMHVMLIMSITALLLGLLGLSERASQIISLVIVCLFVIITGMTPSSVRAGVMVAAATAASFGRRDYDSATSLGLVVIILLLINPFTVYDPSFQLSASATLGIISLSRPIKMRLNFLPDILSDGISLTLSAQLGSLPIMILSFGYISVCSVLANLAVVTFLPVIYVLGILATATGAYPLTLLCGYVLDAITAVAKFVSEIPLGIIDLPPFLSVVAGTVILTVSLVLGGLTVHKRKGITAALAMAGLIITISGSIAGILPNGALEAHFINVGNGDSCLMRLPEGGYILIDTGTAKKCENEVVPYLKRCGVKELEALILSHSHDDHAGGAEYVTDSFNTKRIIYPYADNLEFRDLKTKIHSPAGKGDVFSFNECEIRVLSPDREFKSTDKNEYSMIFRVDYGESSYLFTGDAEYDDLEDVLNTDTDILKVPHHGSKYGLSEDALKNISPEISVISVGRDNKYGHPHSETLEILEAFGSDIYRTDELGLIKLKSKKDGVFIKK